MSEYDFGICTKHGTYENKNLISVCSKCEAEKNLELNILRSRVEELERERKQIAENLSNPLDCKEIANNLRTMRLLSENSELHAELARLREQVRWIPANEYPETNGWWYPY